MQQPPGPGGRQPAGNGVTCQICGTASPSGTPTCPVCRANLAPRGESAAAQAGPAAVGAGVRCQMCGGVSPPGAGTCQRCGANLLAREGRAPEQEAGAAGAVETDEEGRRCACGAVSPLTAPACIVCGVRLLAPLDYEMIGTLMPALQINLVPGQRVYGQTHCLGWMTEGVEMRTLAKGSPWALLGRVASGMTLLVSQFTAPHEPGVVAFTLQLPGRIMSLELGPGSGYILQPGAFLAAQDSVTLHPFFTRNIGAGLFGGEGFILQRLSGYGLAFIQIGGEMVGYELGAGEVLLVDPGSIAAFESTVRFSVRIVKGIANIVFNQGLFLAELRGPGRVWVETMPMSRLIAAIRARGGVDSGSAVRGALSGLSGVFGPV